MSTIKVDTITDEAGTGAPTLSHGVTVAGNVSVDGGTIKLDGNYPVGTGNVALGDQAFGNASGNYNVALGETALYNNTASSNTAIGRYALVTNTSGANNVAIGRDALLSNTTASNNTAVGYQSLYDNTTGSSNVSLGYRSSYNNTTGGSNTAVGYQSYYLATTAIQNTVMGYNSGYNISTGNDNSFFGNDAGHKTTTGASNVAVGSDALRSNTTASQNTAVGYQAGYSNTTGTNNTNFGHLAGYTNTTGQRNAYIGQGAGYSMTTGSKNSILGCYNGNQGGLDIRTSSNNIVLSDGDGNPAMHMAAFNTANDTTPATIRWGNFQGDGSGRGGQFYLDSAQSIWYNSTTGTSLRYHAQFRNPNGLVGHITTTGSSTAYSTSSDYRLKENVVELTGATDRLKQLEPKRFNFIADAGTTVDGFLAHEVQSIVPEAISGEKDAVDADGNPVYQGIDQSKLVPLLVATIQELEARITALEAN